MAYKIEVSDSCIGCRTCVNICPKSFKMNGNKAEPVKSKVDKLSCEKQAEEACPVDAISVKEI